ncbi:MAG: hypothetical protein LM587_00205 [Candidatus Aenigmarchaeota archaeon]|jgi:hypothetical protein|nr:hypothetical protein [Candidatus Aenigmarchaeota archaeon]
MSINHITKKIKLAAIAKIRRAPIWASIRKFGLKRARTRRIVTYPKRWRRTRIRI